MAKIEQLQTLLEQAELTGGDFDAFVRVSQFLQGAFLLGGSDEVRAMNVSALDAYISTIEELKSILR